MKIKSAKLRKMKKRLFASTMIFGLAIVLSSCGGDNKTTSGEVKTTTDLDKTTIFTEKGELIAHLFNFFCIIL